VPPNPIIQVGTVGLQIVLREGLARYDSSFLYSHGRERFYLVNGEEGRWNSRAENDL